MQAEQRFRDELARLEAQRCQFQTYEALWAEIWRGTRDINAEIQGNSSYVTGLVDLALQVFDLVKGVRGVQKLVGYRRANIKPARRSLNSGLEIYGRIKALNPQSAREKGLPIIQKMSGRLGGLQAHYNTMSRDGLKDASWGMIAAAAERGSPDSRRHYNVKLIDGLLAEFQNMTDATYECICSVADDPTSYGNWFQAWCMLMQLIDPGTYRDVILVRLAESPYAALDELATKILRHCTAQQNRMRACIRDVDTQILALEQEWRAASRGALGMR